MKNSIKQFVKSGAVMLALSLAFTACGNIDNPLEDLQNSTEPEKPTVEEIIKYGFKVTDLAGVDKTEAVTSLKMSKTDGTLVATAEVSDDHKITITSKDLTSAAITTAADFWFEAKIGGKPYIAKVNIDPATLSPETDKTLAMATLGNIIGSDGKFYANKTAVDAASTTGVAMIVYLGNEGEKNTDYKRGLAIALADAVPGATWGTYGADAGLTKYTTFCGLPSAETDADTDIAGIANTTTLKGLGDDRENNGLDYDYNAAKAAYAYGVAGFLPSDYDFSGWFLPSAGQWYKFLNGMCGLRWTDFDWASGPGSNNFNAVNKTFTDAGYDAAKFDNSYYYWSSSEFNVNEAVCVGFYSEFGIRVVKSEKYNAYRVRPFIVF